MQFKWPVIALATWYTFALGVLLHLALQSARFDIKQLETRLALAEQRLALAEEQRLDERVTALQAEYDTQVSSIWASLDEVFVVVEELQQLPHRLKEELETLMVDELETLMVDELEVETAEHSQEQN